VIERVHEKSLDMSSALCAGSMIFL